LLEALVKQRPIIVGIDFYALHPDYEKDITRSHGIVIKGYKLDEKGQIKILANDPKPKVGGEIELSYAQFLKAIEKMSMQIIFENK